MVGRLTTGCCAERSKAVPKGLPHLNQFLKTTTTIERNKTTMFKQPMRTSFEDINVAQWATVPDLIAFLAEMRGEE